LSNVAECTIESLFLKFTYCPALTVSGFGEYALFVMKTVMGLSLVPLPLPPDAGVGLVEESQPTAAKTTHIRLPTARARIELIQPRMRHTSCV
jgi:hypothetical protein